MSTQSNATQVNWDCRHCPKFAFCTSPCEVVESLLPSDLTASQIKPKSTYAGSVEDFLQSRMFVAALLTYRQQLSGRQRQVVDLYLNDAATMREAGERLGIGTRTACTYLHRAYRAVAALMERDMEANDGDHELLRRFRAHLRDLRMNTSTFLHPRTRGVRGSDAEWDD